MRMLFREGVGRIELVGSASQKDGIERLASQFSSGVSCSPGTRTWESLRHLLSSADLVISNNSGIGHLASSIGVPCLVIFGGSVSPEEWAPVGYNTLTLFRETHCSPCGNPKLCSFGKKCLTSIDPLTTLEAVKGLWGEVGKMSR